MSRLAQDVRYALRQLLRAPGFTVTAILTLALGIGVTTAAFTLLYGMLLQPLPIPKPEQLYRLGDTYFCCGNFGLPGSGDFDIFSYGNYLHLRKSIPEIQGLAAIQSGPEILSVNRGNHLPKAHHRSGFRQLLRNLRRHSLSRKAPRRRRRCPQRRPRSSHELPRLEIGIRQ